MRIRMIVAAGLTAALIAACDNAGDPEVEPPVEPAEPAQESNAEPGDAAGERAQEALGDIVSAPLDDPFAAECILVPGRGVAQWLGHTGPDLWLGAQRLGPFLLHPLVLVYAASGSAMISATLRIPKI